MEERFVKANELLENESFIEELKMQNNDEEVSALFKKHGADISVEDVEKMVEEAIEYAETLEEDEMDAETLDNVAGGNAVKACFAIAGGIIAFITGYAHSHLKYDKKMKKNKKTAKFGGR